MSGGCGSCDVAGEASRAGKPHAPDVGRSPARDGRGLLAPVHSALMWLPWLTATPRFQSTRGTWECPRHWAPLCPFRMHGHREKGPVCCLILCFPLMLPLLSSCSLQHSPALQDCSVLLYLFIYFFPGKQGYSKASCAVFQGHAPVGTWKTAGGWGAPIQSSAVRVGGVGVGLDVT